MQERLQKIISRAGLASRREAERIITAGRVKVNGKVITELGTKVSPRDVVVVDGKRIRSEEKVYLLMNKPKGIVTTLSDPEGRPKVTDLLKDISVRVYPVGRLDYNSEGLLLLTNDGELTHGLTHPSRHVDKTYLVKVKGIPAEEKLDRLWAGIKLDDGVTAPARVKLIDKDEVRNIAELEITIHEGKNRQIRRMCEAIGHPVRNLKRVQIAFLTLQGLRRGKYRQLEPEEVAELKKLAGIEVEK